MANVKGDALLEYIKTYGIDGYGIALHGVRSLTGEPLKDICEKICNTGVTVNKRYKSLNGTAKGIGRTPEDDDQINEQLENYIWAGEQQVNVIIAYPPVIENSKGEKLYLGYTPPPGFGYDQDTVCSFMDIACSELGYIPKEFVLGYYIDVDYKYGNVMPGEHIDYEFNPNPNFNKVSDELFDTMKEAMGAFASLSKAYAEHDKPTIDKLKKLFDDYGLLPKELVNNTEKDLSKGAGMQF